MLRRWGARAVTAERPAAIWDQMPAVITEARIWSENISPKSYRKDIVTLARIWNQPWSIECSTCSGKLFTVLYESPKANVRLINHAVSVLQICRPFPKVLQICKIWSAELFQSPGPKVQNANCKTQNLRSKIQHHKPNVQRPKPNIKSPMYIAYVHRLCT